MSGLSQKIIQVLYKTMNIPIEVSFELQKIHDIIKVKFLNKICVLFLPIKSHFFQIVQKSPV